MDNFTPMIKQYLDMKKQSSDALLFFRLGDFYEVFFEDAKIVSKELELVLTSRSAGGHQKAPMCGVPHHAVSNYIQRLISKGYKVAIADQMEDPATSKGLVERQIVRIITPGTNLEMEETSVSKLASIDHDLLFYEIALLDISNNQTQQLRIEKDDTYLMLTLLSKGVNEVIVPNKALFDLFKTKSDFTVSIFQPTMSNKLSLEQQVYQRLLEYLYYTQKQVVTTTKTQQTKVMVLDYNAISNLELVASLRTKDRKNSLWGFLDYCKTSMGSRLLNQWIKEPLYELESILNRQEQVSYFIENFIIKAQLEEQLKQVYDVERLSTKVSLSRVNTQDLLRLRTSLRAAVSMSQLVEIKEYDVLNQAQEVVLSLEETLTEEPPLLLKDGYTIKPGVSKELDELRDLIEHHQEKLLEYELAQKEKTGIKNLKVGYSRSFGYYLEVSKGQVDQVKEEFGYIRRQTLTNAQRYTSLELKELEEKLEQASDRILAIEQEQFDQLVNALKPQVSLLYEIAAALASLDVILSFAEVSSQGGYVKPIFNTSGQYEVIQSVHPILETTLKSHQVIANDIIIEPETSIIILTGPNMGGKSTIMRQMALVSIMAQMGLYVKAQSANIPLFDRILTRMGASDDILLGQSTFMIEMSEANQAIRQASKHSLILFDELGRGTSTYDGMSIARAILVYLSENSEAKTIFSTHYHELTDLAQQYPNIINKQVAVHEEKDRITFLYQLVDGATDKSYGIHVAKLADLPLDIIQKARNTLKTYHQQSIQAPTTLTLKEPSKTVIDLAQLDLETLSPIEAFNTLYQLIQQAKQELNEQD